MISPEVLDGWFTETELDAPPAPSIFPAGHWRGVIEQTRVSQVDASAPNAFKLNMYDDGFAETMEIASVQLGGASALAEGQGDPGNLKCFDDNLYLSIDGVAWDSDEITKDSNWRFLATRKRLTKLARALGLVEKIGASIRPSADFGELIRSNGLAGQAVAFEVYHKPWKSKAGKSGTEVLVAGYTQAV